MTYSAVSAQPAVAEINIIPLADIMLVLLVIFMIASPASSHRIPLDLPQPGPHRAEPAPSRPQALRIDGAGQLYWNGSATTTQALAAQMREAAATAESGEPPLLAISADPDSDYQALASVLAIARNAGMHRVGFVRQP
ncbi:biopolymer transporter ExbD [Luteimonas sp. RD2P54]|uniref:Biopolymer transporter ExbD n=1 Tax=Luteimonas endophytica TaxID=3042023 RepID=A0ABT6J722_9GAMM|nr:biopolymer transporter ExbD [Luteimonas endophytica]MDH5822616.1 biopolymer transporter ExbD [Luteimonas endophytica]